MRLNDFVGGLSTMVLRNTRVNVNMCRNQFKTYLINTCEFLYSLLST